MIFKMNWPFRLAVMGAVAVLALLFGQQANAKPKGCTGYGCAGAPSKATGRTRTVPVRPYVRRDGKYVGGTYRSRPAKK